MSLLVLGLLSVDVSRLPTDLVIRHLRNATFFARATGTRHELVLSARLALLTADSEVGYPRLTAGLSRWLS
ncbi:hypothetical protein ACIO1C_01920 [Streptomyces sp. NPDC087420]|uniref:hypothetical protein n=1 Tax=Streptomyces sp. NPDC087420 TaxID=3365785 RepID=UPI003834E519